jgi:hypothetical protein
MNVIVLNKNIQIKINKNNNNRDVCVQACSNYKLENNKYIQTKNKKIMTNNTKCHSEIKVTLSNKSIKIKISKNNGNIDVCTRINSTYQNKYNNFLQAINNKK